MQRTLRLVVNTIGAIGLLASAAFVPTTASRAQQGLSLTQGWQHAALGEATACYGNQIRLFRGGPGLVALDECHSAAWESADASAWRRVSLPPLQLDNVGYWSMFVTGQLYLLYGATFSNTPGPSSTVLWASANAGSTWQRSSSDLQFQTFTSGGDGLLATARAPGSFNAGLWTSSDGLAWRQEPDPAGVFRTADLSLLAHGALGWLAAGSVQSASGPPTSAIWFSSDGRTWGLPVPASGAVTGLVAGPRSFLAIGTKAGAGPTATFVLVSRDGTHWEQAKNAPPGPYFFYFGASGIAPWAGGFAWLADEGGETGVWSSADGLSWTRLGGDDVFGGSAEVGDAVAFNGGIVAAGSFASHPQPACTQSFGADANDVRSFRSAIFVWNPATSMPASPPVVDRFDPHVSKLLPSDLGSGTDLQNFESYRTAYINLCADAPGLGDHRAYRVTFPTNAGGSPGLPANLQGQEITVVTATAAAARAAFLHIGTWMFEGAGARQAHIAARIGDQTRAYSFRLPTDYVPPGSPYKGYAVVWTRDRFIGEVYTTALKLATTLAQKQFDRSQITSTSSHTEAETR
jgi:hypothetical protein